MRLKCILLLVMVVGLSPVVRAQTAGQTDIALLLSELENALQSGMSDDLLPLLSDDAGTRDRLTGFLEENALEGATRVVVHEADRRPLPGTASGVRLMIELLTERGERGRVATWRLDLERVTTDGTETRWRIVDQERLTFVEGLYRLAIDATTQYRVRNLTITAEDLIVTLPEGTAFAIRTDLGTTGLVLQGDGHLQFSPAPEAEQSQIRILSGSPVLDTDFRSAYIRLNPSNYGDVVTGVLTEQPVNRRDLDRAQEIFDRDAPESFTLDLGALSRDRWWVVPNLGDFLADLETRRYDTLTYLHSGNDAEDIKLFDRAGGRMLSSYSSKAKLAARGRFYNEDDGLDYDVLDHDIDVTFAPSREWLQGTARMRVRALDNLTSMTIRLADDLAVQSVTSEPFGRLLALRIPGQNGILLNFPTTIVSGYEFDLTVSYSGRLQPEAVHHQSLAMRDSPFRNSPSFGGQFPAQEPRANYLYSNRSYWYPQSQVTDYATATIRAVVPPPFACVSTGELQPGSPEVLEAGAPGAPPGSRRYEFVATQPVRYLAVDIAELSNGPSTILALGDTLAAARKAANVSSVAGSGVRYDSIELSLESNVRFGSDEDKELQLAEDMVRFFSDLFGDVPYPSLTLAMIESQLPGGHSPAYFSLLNQPNQTSLVLWDRDPVYFRDAPEFFLAHEIAHQWWGQGVGWSNYHEQWLSEGFAQYFAALFARQAHDESTFDKIVRQMRDWALEHTEEGPIYLGYRLGHIEGDEEVFRSILYNKSAMVIHMLRRLIGDDAFFAGVRRFYASWRFKKAGTEDLRHAFEESSGRSLERFFEGWVHGTAIPELTFSYRTDDGSASGEEQPGQIGVLRFEQRGPIFDLPVTVTLKYASGESENIIAKITDQVTEIRVPLHGSLRSAEVNRDFAALARIDKR